MFRFAAHVPDAAAMLVTSISMEFLSWTGVYFTAAGVAVLPPFPRVLELIVPVPFVPPPVPGADSKIGSKSTSPSESIRIVMQGSAPDVDI